jgi:hypothetical protein
MGMYASVHGWLQVDHKQREAVESVITDQPGSRQNRKFPSLMVSA